jgi:RNA polymerase sigma-70 factor (ECF subfamily)
MLSGVASGGETRTWSDATGVFTVEAEMVGLTDGVVYLKLASGKVINVALEQLSANDQEYARSTSDGAGESKAKTAPPNSLLGKPTELKNDDGKATGKKSLPMGIASAFTAPEEGCYITEVRIHGSRYGYPQAPKEDFHVTLCDKDFNPIADFPFPYSKFERGGEKWVTLRVKATEVPKDFVICLDFKAERTKGVYVSHDKEGKSLVGLPKKKAGAFTGGDWMVRVFVDRLKEQAASVEQPAAESKE